MRLRDLADGARRRLEAAGVPRAEAALDVELLARDVVGWDRATWLLRKDDDEHAVDAQTVSSHGTGAFRAAFDALIARRVKREPMAYIRGTQEFYGREFLVGPGVLIPRPETELLIDEAKAAAMGRRTPRLADVGTGSGCLAVTLALELPSAVVIATDISAEALTIARGNAAAHEVGGRVTFVETSYLTGIAGAFDVIVANPPYIRDGDGPGLAPEVRDHEPSDALFGGSDGLRDIKAIAQAATTALKPGGVLIMEIGLGQAKAVAAVLTEAGLGGDLTLRRDLQGIARVAVAHL